MSKNPFQILDFLGYFFPGATVMIALYYYVPWIQEHISITTNTSAIVYIICIIIAYIIGHLVSLLSSITVEKYANWRYGYPSDYLLNDYKPKLFLSRGSSLESESISQKRGTFLKISKKVLRIFVWLFLLPISVLDFFLAWVFGIDYYYTRKLSEQQVSMITGKGIILFRNIGIAADSTNLFQGDNHRIVHNYYYENANKHSSRMENCIAIYDFLRAMTFVMNVCFMILFVRALSTISFYAPVDWQTCQILLVLAILSYMFFMGFQKFYRKFTIENYMCLICDKNLDFPQKEENVLYTGNGVQAQTNNQGFTFKH